ncbi:hypothetical protein DFH06DRAFT_628744 [Mycena polygramma]|nr:hypothetical protein DFH06DRAFT_628744 [Mycena polygramma]
MVSSAAAVRRPLAPLSPAFASQMAPTPLAARAPQRLQSPILLDACLPSPGCSPTKRRRTVRPQRRRHCARAECAIESALHPFDSLPWISAMDTMPDAFDLADIADLSQLVIDEPPPHLAPRPSVSGPIRRRKTSLRSTPLGPRSRTSHENTPHTPRSHIDYSRVTFHNLMPVFSCDRQPRS